MSEARTSPEPPADPSPREVLLRTKLYRRGPPPSLVPRPRLVERLNQGLSSRLVLVSAPAGFGKTTLLSEWLERCPCAVAWVSLDSGDDDPSTFLRYLVAALQTAAPEVGRSVEALLRSSQVPSLEPILTVLLNDLASLPQDLVLVLEDYHSIANSAVHSGIDYLLDHLPPTIHLVIATRADPPLPLARLRSRGELVEVRADDLRFEQTEAKALVEGTAEISLTLEESAALQTKTEGWAAGLQLAALSLRGRRGREDISRFVADFAGSNRYVVDYLLQEVLGGQPEVVRTFLLKTSILEQLSAPLCEAVTEQPDAQTMLDRLERANLFLTPLDDERRWYRYHHLFGEVLQAQLRRQHPDLLPSLHSRASEWHEAQSLFSQAFSHAALAADWERATALLEKEWWLITQLVGSATVLGYIDRLPREYVRSSPILSRTASWLLWLTGQLDQVESHLEDADHAIRDRAEARGVSAEEIERELPPGSSISTTAAIRSHLARHRGDLEAAQRFAEQALATAPSGNPLVLGAANLALGHAAFETGQWTQALDAFTRGLSFVKAAGNLVAASITTLYIAKLHEVRGQLGRAEGVCRETLRFADSAGLSLLPSVGVVHVALADVLCERDERAEAERQLRQGLDLARGGAFVEAVKNGALVEARLRQAEGDVAGAWAVLEEALEAGRRQANPLVEAELRARLVRLRAGVDRLDRAAEVQRGRLQALDEDLEWATTALARQGAGLGYTTQVVFLALARLLIARDQAIEAAERLGLALEAADSDGLSGFAIQARVLRALACQRMGRQAEALDELGRALAFAEPEGYIRVFVDEGEPIARLLADLLQSLVRRSLRTGEGSSYSPEYVSRLLAAFHKAGEIPSVTPSPQPGMTTRASGADPAGRQVCLQPLVEPLSEREIEVLALMAEGLTNEQIAKRLIISVGTVKAHVHNISGKLGAQNRAHAVSRAKELGLL